MGERGGRGGGRWISLRELLAFDEGGVLRLLLAPSGEDVHVNGMIIGDEGPARSYAHRVVLAAGLFHSTGAATASIREAAARGAAAVVVRAGDDLPSELVDAAEQVGVALLARAEWADWDDVATLLRSALAYADAGRGDRMADATAGGGLAALASVVAEFTGGSITIEDTGFRVLAHSATGPEADELRRSTILGGRVPDWRVEELRRSGLLRALWSSDEVIHRPADGDSPERLIIAIRSGREMLGSIWAAADGRGLTPNAASALSRAAEVAVPYLAQHRLRESAARRREEHALRGLLDGDGDMSTHAWTLGLPPDLRCGVVLAELDVSPQTQTYVHTQGQNSTQALSQAQAQGQGQSLGQGQRLGPAQAQAQVQDLGQEEGQGRGTRPSQGQGLGQPGQGRRFGQSGQGRGAWPGPEQARGTGLAPGQARGTGPAPGVAAAERTVEVLALQAAAYRSGVRVLREGTRVLALLPLERGDDRDLLGLARDLDGLASSMPGAGRVRVGAGPAVASPLLASASREEAELVVRVLRAEEARGRGERRYASAAEVRPALDVLRVLDAVRPVLESGSGPVHDLVRTDLATGGELVRSIAAYLDAGGDVRVAARRLVLHPNTLRYRLRRARERFGVDLDDPDTRLLITLAVRLTETP
ncbi:helix-turn-helix domain-containing protein [Nonomuraea pusilla]|uniref:PucR family transcriptional regulator n=1 Tax=Nonomuraea pusilla TaxID=46177 RepID=UPI0033346CF6